MLPRSNFNFFIRFTFYIMPLFIGFGIPYPVYFKAGALLLAKQFFVTIKSILCLETARVLGADARLKRWLVCLLSLSFLTMSFAFLSLCDY
jgi:hypothetical protein